MSDDRGMLGNGVELQVGNASGGTSSSWTTIALTIGDPKRQDGGIERVDKTVHGDLEARAKPGIGTPGTITFQCLYDPNGASFTLLQSMRQNHYERDMKLVDPNTEESTETFEGYVENISKDYQLHGNAVMDVSIVITAATTFDANPS